MVAGGGFYSYYIHKGINQIKKGKLLSFMHTKRFNIFFSPKMGAIPRRILLIIRHFCYSFKKNIYSSTNLYDLGEYTDIICYLEILSRIEQKGMTFDHDFGYSLI